MKRLEGEEPSEEECVAADALIVRAAISLGIYNGDMLKPIEVLKVHGQCAIATRLITDASESEKCMPLREAAAQCLNDATVGYFENHFEAMDRAIRSTSNKIRSTGKVDVKQKHRSPKF